MDKQDQILEHYRAEAQKHGLKGTSSIQDLRTRRLEIEAIFSYLRDGERVLEVGCGNGYTAQAVVENFGLDLDAFDYSRDLLELAKQRDLGDAKGQVKFFWADVLELDKIEYYDTVLTERCLQNLLSWSDQQAALENIARALKPGGQFVMLECFYTGLNILNEARRELELPEIEPPWHNVWFDENATKNYMATVDCDYVDQNRFLSGYYFGSRIILPAIMPKGKSVTSTSRLNDYFCELPSHGDFCPMKILRFRKHV